MKERAVTATVVTISNSAGSSRRSRRPQNASSAMPRVRPHSASNSEVIR